jgi:biopolymer transport protein ExbB
MRSFAAVNSVPWRLALWMGLALLIAGVLWNGIPMPHVQAQTGQDVAGPSGEPEPVGSEGASVPPAAPASSSINVLSLALRGGIFMIPIFCLSLLAGTMVIERFLGLRRNRILPEGLVAGLGQLAGSQGTFDPRRAYKLCQEYPSAAANVIRAMLVKVGRPVAEIETSVSQASQREADKLYANVRWLNITTSLATMFGLLGTIQGMILAFHQLTGLAPNNDRVIALAGGIYTALVTTFAGLSVAIPSAFFSHLFEGKIQSAFREIDELVATLLPQLERYEGRLRFNRQPTDGEPRPTEADASDKQVAALAGRE